MNTEQLTEPNKERFSPNNIINSFKNNNSLYPTISHIPSIYTSVRLPEIPIQRFYENI